MKTPKSEYERIMDERINYKRCPVKGCGAVSGFCLSAKQIAEDKEYICQNCNKETKLSKWKESSIKEYNESAHAIPNGYSKGSKIISKRGYGRK